MSILGSIIDTIRMIVGGRISHDAMIDKLNLLAEKNREKLNWRESIVDLMKLVGLDSSLDSRKKLADELGYTGELNGSAAMNIWLHKKVMDKLAEHGGNVPNSLKD